MVPVAAEICLIALTGNDGEGGGQAVHRGYGWGVFLGGSEAVSAAYVGSALQDGSLKETARLLLKAKDAYN